jgi:TetR/AcrR family transcriptional regulator, transcriptional repressor for nem operon
MRYGKDHKQATRQRILEAAGRRFKQDGIDGAGVAAVMSDAGLTNGAFYAHFASKEDLLANVLADQLRAQRQSFDAQPPDRGGLKAFIRSYLSPQHRDQSADGYPSAALLEEIARRPAATKQVFIDELMGVIDDIASRLNPTHAEAADGPPAGTHAQRATRRPTSPAQAGPGRRRLASNDQYRQ